MKLYKYNTALETARALIKHLLQQMEEEPEKKVHLAFSGGTTPSLMFSLWAAEFKDVTPWNRMCIYWVDERCVPAADAESNYGTMARLMLNAMPVPLENVFPIQGTRIPTIEAVLYSDVIRQNVPWQQNIPVFDAVLLGAGEDGHTSSIFPGQESLLSSCHLYEVSVNPYQGQTRIAMTGRLILHAKRVLFLITGKNKAKVVGDILGSRDAGPAAYVAHHAREVELFVDEEAGGAPASV